MNKISAMELKAGDRFILTPESKDIWLVRGAHAELPGAYDLILEATGDMMNLTMAASASVYLADPPLPAEGSEVTLWGRTWEVMSVSRLAVSLKETHGVMSVATLQVIPDYFQEIVVAEAMPKDGWKRA